MEYKNAVFQEAVSEFQKELTKCHCAMLQREIEALPQEYQKAVLQELIKKLKLISECRCFSNIRIDKCKIENLLLS